MRNGSNTGERNGSSTGAGGPDRRFRAQIFGERLEEDAPAAVPAPAGGGAGVAGRSLAEECRAADRLPSAEGAGGVEGLLRWGGEALKEACASLGIKAGGTPGERAARLLRTSGVPRAGWDKALLVAQGGKWKRRREEAGEGEASGAGEGAA
jgi:hypothetical protein